MPVVINFLRTVRYLHTHEMAARLAFYYSWNIFTARKKLLRTYNLWKIFYNWAPKARKFWHFMSKIPYFRILSWEWAHKTEGVPWGGTPKKPIFRNWGGGHPKPLPLNTSLVIIYFLVATSIPVLIICVYTMMKRTVTIFLLVLMFLFLTSRLWASLRLLNFML